MNILIAYKHKIPVEKYGGTQRIIWWLGKALVNLGHKVTYLVKKGSHCPFADVIPFDMKKPLKAQIPEYIDLVHFHYKVNAPNIDIPFVATIHGNAGPGSIFHENSIFLSHRHASNHNSDVYVYNGIDTEDYGNVLLDNKREHLLFLGKISRKSKNLKGCIKIAQKANMKLAIVGGHGLSFDRRIQYKGYLGGEKKKRVIQQSLALLFPILWEEPFGLAIIESLYFGSPVLGTPYGSLPELIHSEVGFLSNRVAELVKVLKNLDQFDRKKCHEYVCDSFSATVMAQNYVKLYERVGSGEKLHSKKPVKRDIRVAYEMK
ncbi:MAG: glycosyltransferase family 4 protein [Gemmatimonadota bacterium]|nr:MAG: glycosyltransferase family 4 protein [Gemmatimonadota bacterium]